MKYDIAIVVLPFVRPDCPSGPGKLKAYVEQFGFNCKILDWNIDLWHELKKQELWGKGLIEYEWKDSLKRFTEKKVEEIKSLNLKYIGLSAFSYPKTTLFLTEVCKILRSRLPDIKIIIGGHCVAADNCGKIMKSKGLVDYFVIGEGEEPLLNLLKNKDMIAGVNGSSPEQIKKLDSLPFPDYSDYNLDLYNNKFLYVETSRGCIFKCNFCRRPLPTFKYKSGYRVAKEILFLNKKYKINKIHFEDSLLNGNPKELKNLCSSIIKLNDEGILPKINWSGFINILPKKVMKAEIFYLMKKSGCVGLSFGVESASEKVRNDMRKIISDSNIDFTINQCYNNNIPLTICFMIGYPTETEEDFNKNLEFVRKHSDKADKINIILGATYILQDETEIFNKQKEMGIEIDIHGNWFKGNNNLPIRFNRWLRFKNLVVSLGYSFDNKNEYMLRKLYKKYEE